MRGFNLTWIISTKKDYAFPQEVYTGTIRIAEKEKAIHSELESKGARLPLTVRLGKDGKIFILARRTEGSISFTLKTILPSGESVKNCNACGQLNGGKFTNWSANMSIG
jgi:hypothetical protein